MVADQLTAAVFAEGSQLRSSGTYLRRVDPASLLVTMGPFPPPAYEARYISTVWNFIKFFLDWVLAFAGVVFLVLSFVGYRLAEVKARWAQQPHRDPWRYIGLWGCGSPSRRRSCCVARDRR